MFNVCDPKNNGERLFFSKIQDRISTVFDVGCREDSEFVEFKGTVHYFEPNSSFLENLKKQKSENSKSYYNNFGLSDQEGECYYYPKYQSFLDRVKSCYESDEKNKIKLSLKTGKDYVTEYKIDFIDFLKIDTEGYEYKVIRGFEDEIKKVGIIQFEYGGTYKDSGTTLKEVVEYLKDKGFVNFAYLTRDGTQKITDFTDHYNYCNIVCENNSYTLV